MHTLHVRNIISDPPPNTSLPANMRENNNDPCKFRFPRSPLGNYFYLQRSRQIRERKALFFFLLLLLGEGDHFSVSHVQFLSAAKPTDQGEEGVVLLLLVVVGGLFSSFPCTVFGV